MSVLQIRAELLARTRTFFKKRNVLEVETPVLSAAGNPDCYIESMTSQYNGPGGKKNLYLQTSPEFAMKRLLAAGSGSIYQICKSFRDGELGRMHNPEFTMLEWYRQGYDYHQLMQEIGNLLVELGLLSGGEPIKKLTYQELFEKYTGLDPFRSEPEELSAYMASRNITFHGPVTGLDRDTSLDLIQTHIIEPALIDVPFLFVHDYPSSRASLAKIRAGDPPVAERFELYGQGIELANGFTELTDGSEQSRRFMDDLHKRSRNGQVEVTPDQNLIDALDHGMCECAGVAMGFDRLVMIAARKAEINDVLAFSFNHA